MHGWWLTREGVQVAGYRLRSTAWGVARRDGGLEHAQGAEVVLTLHDSRGNVCRVCRLGQVH